MKITNFTTLLTLISLLLVPITATKADDSPERAARLTRVPSVVRSPLITKDPVIRSAFYDTLSILLGSNGFFTNGPWSIAEREAAFEALTPRFLNPVRGSRLVSRVNE